MMPSTHDFCCPARGLDDNLRIQAAEQPDHTALLYYGRRISYGALWEEVQTLARFMACELGVRRGDRIAIDMQNCPQFIIAYYAVLRAGAVVIPLNPMYRAAEVAKLLQDAGVVTVIAGSELLDRFSEPGEGASLSIIVAHYAEYLPDDPVGPPPQLASAPAPGDRSHVRLISWRDALAAGSGVDRIVLEAAHHAPEDLCVMPYTSGSTGAPKGCPHTHAAAMHTAVAQAQWYGLSANSVVTAVQPLFHVAGMQGSMNAGIYAGATLLLLTRWDAAAAIRLFALYGVTFFNAPPTMVVDLLSQPDFDDAAFSKLEVITGGGAAMPVAVAARLKQRFGLVYTEGYGMSETMSPTHLNPMHDPRPGCVGIPIQQTVSLIIDPDSLAILPDNDIGEIVVAGPQVLTAYWNNISPDSFAEINGVRMLRTGDLGFRDSDGYYHIVDRLKRMINASGFKVWPAEVEEVLFAHDAVEQCCVVAAPDEYRGETVAAVVILKPEAKGITRPEDLIAWTRDRLAVFKAPRRIVFVDSLPRTASHKIDWRRVEETMACQPLRS